MLSWGFISAGGAPKENTDVVLAMTGVEGAVGVDGIPKSIDS